LDNSGFVSQHSRSITMDTECNRKRFHRRITRRVQLCSGKKTGRTCTCELCYRADGVQTCVIDLLIVIWGLY
jgi:hypothetical protein